jgi:hypothetical protein
MNAKLILTLVSALAAAPAVAGEWQTVSADAKETVLLQSDSIQMADGDIQVKVVRDYRNTQLNLFDEQWVAHRSKVLMYSVDCEAGKLGFLEWSLHAGSQGKGRAVVKGKAGGVVDYVKAANMGDAAVLDAVCAKLATIESAKNRLVASAEDNF